MKRDMKLWQFFGFAVTAFLGTLLHFLYDFAGNSFTALFSSVNESTFEHMKLLFFPMFLFAIVESFFVGKDYKNFWCIKLKGTLLGLFLIPALFYLYNGAVGKSPDWLNVLIFFVSAAVAYIYEKRLFDNNNTPCRFRKLAFILLCLIAVAFWVFTFMPPKIPLFQDPILLTYGLQ